MQKFALCLLFVFALYAVAPAQEKSPKPPASADERIDKLLQAIVDMEAEQQLQNDYFAKELADSRHNEDELRKECAALQAKIEKMEMECLEARLDDALERQVELREKAIDDINGKLNATRSVSVGPFGRRQQRAYVVTGTERDTLIARRDKLQKERGEAKTMIIKRIFAKVQDVTVTMEKAMSDDSSDRFPLGATTFPN